MQTAQRCYWVLWTSFQQQINVYKSEIIFSSNVRDNHKVEILFMLHVVEVDHHTKSLRSTTML